MVRCNSVTVLPGCGQGVPPFAQADDGPVVQPRWSTHSLVPHDLLVLEQLQDGGRERLIVFGSPHEFASP